MLRSKERRPPNRTSRGVGSRPAAARIREFRTMRTGLVWAGLYGVSVGAFTAAPKTSEL
jgi:hypothetical protein